VVLGVVPLLTMALFVWFREHHPETLTGSSVVALAHAMDLCPCGSFALRRGLAEFLHAYFGIVQTAGASQTHHDAARCATIDDSGRTTERWLKFADGLAHGCHLLGRPFLKLKTTLNSLSESEQDTMVK
jgi:hypothetical protein